MQLIRYALLFTAILQLGGCNSSIVLPSDSVKDKDWNTSFTSNCPLPEHDSIRWISENNQRYVRFTLADGDKGGCSTDKTARHSAPYWERAELKQVGTLTKNKLYSVEATLRFVEGFSGERETFLQIHAYNGSCKHAYPPIMIAFDSTRTNRAVLTLFALQSSGHHNGYRSNMHIEDILGDWIDLKLKLDTSNEGTIAMLIDGETIFSEIPFRIERCGTPHIKFGAYRPGNLSGNAKSTVDIDSINVN